MHAGSDRDSRKKGRSRRRLLSEQQAAAGQAQMCCSALRCSEQRKPEVGEVKGMDFVKASSGFQGPAVIPQNFGRVESVIIASKNMWVRFKKKNHSLHFLSENQMSEAHFGHFC